MLMDNWKLITSVPEKISFWLKLLSKVSGRWCKAEQQICVTFLFSKIRIIISHLVQGPTRIFLGTKMDTKMFYSFTSNRTWHCWFLRLVNDLFEFSLTLFLQEGCSIRMLNPQTYSKNVWYFAARLQEYFGCFVGSNV